MLKYSILQILASQNKWVKKNILKLNSQNLQILNNSWMWNCAKSLEYQNISKFKNIELFKSYNLKKL